jgi:hypothetical protein
MAVKDAYIMLVREECFHGAKAKQCSSEGCTNHVINGGVYLKHGAKLKQCSSEGYTNYARKGGVFWRHGATLKQCSSNGSQIMLKKEKVCWRRGAKDRNPYLKSLLGENFEIN